MRVHVFFGKRRFKRYWRKWYARNREEFRRGLRTDPFRYLEGSRPDTSARLEFNIAVEILAGDGPADLAKAYLQRVLTMLRRIQQQGLLESGGGSALYPSNRGELTRLEVYANMLLGQELDSNALKHACHDYETWATSVADAEWDSMAEYMHLTAVRLALVIDDVKHAAELLERARPIAAEREQADLLRGLIQLHQDRLDAKAQKRLRRAFEKGFDRIRAPNNGADYREATLAPLELAILRERYWEAPGAELRWQRVVAAFAA